MLISAWFTISNNYKYDIAELKSAIVDNRLQFEQTRQRLKGNWCHLDKWWGGLRQTTQY